MVERLRDPETRRRAVEDLAAGWYGGIPWLWDRVLVSRCADAGSSDGTSWSLPSPKGSPLPI